MKLIPRNSLFDFESFFDDSFIPMKWTNDMNKTFSPRVDIKDKEDGYQITADLPGVKKEDLHVNLENGILSIEAETKQEDKEEKDGTLIRQERRYGKYVRSFSVGENINQDKIKASFKDGVLNLDVPKLETKKLEKAKKIEIL